jgi:ankyrin repeat protein
LHLAVDSGAREIVTALLNAGDDRNGRTKERDTPLSIARERLEDHKRVLDLLHRPAK